MESKKNTILKVLRLITKLLPAYLPTLFVAKLVAAAEMFPGIIFGSIILDMIISKEPVSDIMEYVLIMVFSILVIGVLRWGLDKIIIVQKRIISVRINQIICEKSFQLDYETLEKKSTLELIHKANEGMSSYGGIWGFCSQFGDLIERICKIVYSVGLLAALFLPVTGKVLSGFGFFLNQWYSGVFTVFFLVLTLLASYLIKRWIGRREQEVFDKNVEANRRFRYFFGFVYRYESGKDIRLYRMKDMIMNEIEEDNIFCENIAAGMLKNYHLASVAGSVIGAVFEASSYIYVGLKAIAGLISTGNVLRYVGAMRELSVSLSGIIEVYVSVEIQSKYLAYFSDFLEIENRKNTGTLPVREITEQNCSIEFRDVSFRYPNNSHMVLSHVNITLETGSKMALVGKNGAGKSTFVKLLCRLYDPTEGEILLNGINIKEYDYYEYMKVFSVVFQDYKLFSFSLAENVSASLDFNHDRIEECLGKAGFGERLETMTEGIHTNIYQLQEKGIELSGGEAQKIAIARALYKNAPVVILDEPTSALDPVSEYDIYKRFDDMVEEKTTLYISHRMSSCRFCDRIIVFDEGGIVQSGTHDELLTEKDKLYSQLWNAQAQYYFSGTERAL